MENANNLEMIVAGQLFRVPDEDRGECWPILLGQAPVTVRRAPAVPTLRQLEHLLAGPRRTCYGAGRDCPGCLSRGECGVARLGG